jgi:hypothetical protein
VTETLDQYDFWRRRMAGEVVPIHDGEPQAGFYRKKANTGDWLPVAYWFTPDNELRCRIGKTNIEDQRAREVWPHISKHPITHDVYKAVVGGAPWPDQHEAVTRDTSNSAAAPDDNSFDALKDRIEDLAREADKLIAAGAAATQEQADQASDLANRLGELAKKADTARVEEKRPHDEAAKAVQAKWLPLIGAADIYKRIKAAVVTPFLAELDRKRREAEAAARRAAEEAAKTGAPAPEPPPAATAPVKAGSGGRRSVALRTVKDIEIADRDVLLAYFKDNQQITDLLQTMAERAVRAGVDVPGVKITERKVAA